MNVIICDLPPAQLCELADAIARICEAIEAQPAAQVPQPEDQP